RTAADMNARTAPYLLSLPTLAFMAALFLAPVGYLLIASLMEPVRGGGTRWTLDMYGELLSDPYILQMIWRTFKVSAITTAAALILAFPVALYMRQVSPRRRSIIGFVMLS